MSVASFLGREASLSTNSSKYENKTFQKNSNVTFNGILSKDMLPRVFQVRRFSLKKRGAATVKSMLKFSSNISAEADKAASLLITSASSIIMYRQIFRDPPGQAFLQILLALKRGDTSKAAEWTGELINLLHQEKISNWNEYILEGILRAEENPFALLASTNGGMPPGTSSEALRSAAAADLSNLQRISLCGDRLVNWISGNSNAFVLEWKFAVSSNLGRKNSNFSNLQGLNSRPQLQQEIFEVENQDFAFSEKSAKRSPFADFQEPRRVDFEETNNLAGFDEVDFDSLTISLVPNEEERASWRSAIGSLEKWSTAIPALELFYSKIGVGAPAKYTFLEWKDKSIVPSNYPMEIKPALHFQKPTEEEILKILENHLAGKWCPHILLYGLNGMGKTTLLKSIFAKLAKKGLRVITLTRAEVIGISKILEALENFPQHKFVIFLDDLAYKSGDDSGLLTLKWKLESSRQPWPKNAILAVTSPSKYFGREGPEDWTGQICHELSDLFHFVAGFPSHLTIQSFEEVVYEISKEDKIEVVEKLQEFSSRNEYFATSKANITVLNAVAFVKALAAE